MHVPEVTLLRIPEAADALRVSRQTVYRLINDGLLPAVTVGGVTRINRDDLAAYVAANTRRAAS